MFEPKFLGQVRIAGLGQNQPAAPAAPAAAPSAGAPTPASSDARFAVPADQNFLPMSPFQVPFVAGWAYPPQYPPGQFDCVLNADGASWTCTPKAPAVIAPPVVLAPSYPVVPVGGGFY